MASKTWTTFLKDASSMPLESASKLRDNPLPSFFLIDSCSNGFWLADRTLDKEQIDIVLLRNSL
eukprot:12188394-Karenia_brevis.AAC.1